MFEDPTSGGSFVEDGKYIAKVLRLEPVPPSPAHPDWGASIKWILALADYQNPTQAITRDDGELYEYWKFTNAKITPNSETRRFIEALLQRQVFDTDKGADLAAEVIGKKAEVMIGPKAKKDGSIRAGEVLSISPYRPTVAAAAPAKSAEVAVLEDDKPPSLLGPGDTGETF